jgi:hypothetical protein
VVVHFHGPVGPAEHVAANLVSKVADLEFVAGKEPALGDFLAVDPDPVRAAQIPGDEVAFDLGDGTVFPADFLGIEQDVAFLMAAEEQDGLIHQNAGAVGQG